MTVHPNLIALYPAALQSRAHRLVGDARIFMSYSVPAMSQAARARQWSRSRS